MLEVSTAHTYTGTLKQVLTYLVAGCNATAEVCGFDSRHRVLAILGRQILPRAPGVEISVHVKEPKDGQDYPQGYAAASPVAVVAL